MADPTIDRRAFLQMLGISPVALATGSAVPPVAAIPKPEPLFSHLPENYDDFFRLSTEQKIMLSAAVASGGDAVAYYKLGENGFTLQKGIDLYHKNNTIFARSLALDPSLQQSLVLTRDGTLRSALTSDGMLQIPVHADGRLTTPIIGVIVIHPSNTRYNAEEPESCKVAKRKMAVDIVQEHADLFGLGSNLAELKRRETQHRSMGRKKEFFITLIKDMFSTLPRNMDFDPQQFADVQYAHTAETLKKAFRHRQNISSADQYSHVLGVSEVMGLSIDLAINDKNNPAAKPVMNHDVQELVELLTLLHDIGKTQMPSQYFTDYKTDQAGSDFAIARNGSHPLFTLMTLLLYENDALTTASHHSGIKRYGAEEIADMVAKKRVSPGFNEFTELRGNDLPETKISPLSRVMRIADVTEAATASGRSDKAVDFVLRELATNDPGQIYRKLRMGKDGKAIVNPDTIDPEYLCFLIKAGVFHAYGKKRAADMNGWKDKNGVPKYDEAKVEAIGNEIMARFQWDDQKQQAMRERIACDPLLLENTNLSIIQQVQTAVDIAHLIPGRR